MQPRVVVSRSDSGNAFCIDDRIFLGEGLFESIRVEKAKPCFAHLHWQRLGDSARSLGIPFDLSFEDWYGFLIAEIRSDNLFQGGIKAILSGGSAPRGLAERGHISHLMFQTFNYTHQIHPLKLMRAAWDRDSANPVYHVKSVNYLEAILAKRQALQQGFDEALFFNTQGFATETTSANFFLISERQIVTPPLTDGVLPGVMRGRVFSLCKELRIDCIEQSVSTKILENAEALFLTNALQGVQAISDFSGKTYNPAHPFIEALKARIFEEEPVSLI